MKTSRGEDLEDEGALQVDGRVVAVGAQVPGLVVDAALGHEILEHAGADHGTEELGDPVPPASWVDPAGDDSPSVTAGLTCAPLTGPKA